MSFTLIVAGALLMVMAALHLATPLLYGTNTETIGMGVFGLTYLILGLLLISGIQYVPITTLVVTSMGTFGVIKSGNDNVELQRMSRSFLILGAAIIALLIFFFISRYI